MKRAYDFSGREHLIKETWTGAFPQLLAAYEHIYHIWDYATRCDAEKALAAWIDDISQGQKEVWKDLVSTVSEWRGNADLFRDLHPGHQRLHGVDQSSGQGQEPR